MNTLKLRAVDGIDCAFYYDGLCSYCGHVFIYKSHNSFFFQLRDFYLFKSEFKKHTDNCDNGCFDERLEDFMNGLTHNKETHNEV